MTTPANRTVIQVARGTYANLSASLGDLQEGEICYAKDRNQLYVIENGALTALDYSVSEGPQTADFIRQIAGGEYTGEPMGHADRTASAISFDNATRTFSIAPTGTLFDVWCKGVKYQFTGAESVTIPNTTGLYYIYFDANGDLQYRTSYFDWPNDAPTAYIYWNATAGAAQYIADERHGIVLDWQTHEYLHRTRGAVLANGFSVSNYTTTGSGTVDSDAELDLGGGTFFDEDLEVNIVHSNTPTSGTWEQDLAGPAQIPVLYLNGTEWYRATTANAPLKVGSVRAQYNLLSGGSWSTVDADANKYIVSFLIATNNLTYPVLAILGQDQYTNIGGAEEVDFSDLVLTDFPSVEFRPLYKLVYQVGAYGNTYNARLVSVLDLRAVERASVAGTIASDHGLLSGLGDDDHLQYVHVSEDRTITASHTISGTLDITNTTSSTSAATGALTVTGGVGIGENLYVGGDFYVTGNTTFLDTQNLQVEDKNIEIGKVASPSDTSANGGGLTLLGNTNKTITWQSSNASWAFSENIDIASGKDYKINGTSILSQTTLGASVINSSLTSVGTITTGVWNGSAIPKAYLDTSLVSTDDTGTVTSAMIANGTIVNEDISATAAIVDSKLATIGTANKVLITALNIDGATDIGGALTDADLIIVDDGGAGTNRKAAVTRITDYTFDKISGDVTITSAGVATIANDSHTHDGRYYTETESDARFLGISAKAADSNLLDGVDSGSFLRSDTADSASGLITFTSGIVVEDSTIGVGDKSADNWTEILHTASNGYGFTWQHSNASVFVNQQGTTNEALVIGDVDAGANSGLFGVSHSQDNGANWTKKLDLYGNGELFIVSSGNFKCWHASNDGSGSGLDADLLDGIDSGSFLRSDADDTATGNITFSGSVSSYGPTITGSNAGGPKLAINCTATGGKQWWIISNGSGNTDGAGYLQLWNHTDSFSPVTFGYSSGTPTEFRTGIEVNNNTVWHAGNDGSGSGLDADTVDGYNIGTFGSAIPLLNGNNTWSGTNVFSVRMLATATGRSVTIGGNPSGNPNGNVATQTSYLEIAAGSGGATNSSAIVFHNPNVSTSGMEYVNTDVNNGYFNFKSDDATWNVRINNNTIWHAGNDGSGSGLDADLLDGQQGSYYQPASNALTTSTTFGGDVSGTYNAIVVANDSHTHDGRYYTEAESDARFLGISAKAADSNLLDGIDSGSFLRSDASDIATGPIAWDGTLATFDPPGGGTGTDTATDVAIALESGLKIAGWIDGYIRTLLKWTSSGDIEIGQGGTSLISGINLLPGGSGVAKVNGNTIWHAGNDGSGSGLDADLLDGINSGSFLRSDAADTMTGLLTKTDTGIYFSSNATGGVANNTPTALTYGILSGYGTFYVNADTDGSTTEYLYLTAGYARGSTTGLRIGHNVNSLTWQGNAVWNASNDGSGSGLDADLVDGYQASGLVNSTHTATSEKVNLAVGWYTIAVNAGDRAVARFGVRDTQSGRHQSVVFYASHKFGSFSELTVLHSSRHGGNPFRYIRIKEGGTYDGALLQIYVDDSGNALTAYLLGDNFQSGGWLLKDWIPDGTNPGNVNNFGALTNVAAQIDLDNILDGGMATTGEIFAGGDTTQYRVWHQGNDGSGSGLDADLLDGLNSGSFLRSDADDGASGSISFTNSYYEFGNGTGSVSNDGGWNARVNVAGSGHARLDVTSVSDGIITTMYSHTGHGAGKVGTYSNHRLVLMCNGTERASLSTSGTLDTTQQGTLWGAGNDGAGSGLDADTVDGLQASQFLRSDTSDTMSGDLTVTGTGSFGGKVDFQGDAAIEGGSGYGIFKGYTHNNNHLITSRGIITGSTSSPTITGGHETTLVEYCNTDTSGFYFKRSDTGTYTEIARITRTGILSLGNTVWHAGNDGAGSGLDADLFDGLNSSSFLRSDTANTADVRLLGSDGRGLRFFDSDSYKIYMSSAGNATWGGRLDNVIGNLSDYNMYFRMAGGTNRGFVFKNNTTNIFQIESTGQVRAQGQVIAPTFKSTASPGTAPFVVSSTSVVSNLNADLLDGLHASVFVRTNDYSAIQDSFFLAFGNSSDWKLYHDGSNNYMDLVVGDLILRDSTISRYTFKRTSPYLLLSTSSGTYTDPNNTTVPVVKCGNSAAVSTAHAILSVQVNGSSSGDPFVSFDVNGVTGWSAGIDNSDNDNFKISQSWSDVGANTRVTITSSRVYLNSTGSRGYSGYVITSPSDTVANAIRAYGYIEWQTDVGAIGTSYFLSDERKKDNIAPSIFNSSNLIESIDFISFDWKPESGNEGHVEVGVSGQQLQSINERLVNELSDGTLMVNEPALVAHMAKALKECIQEIKDLKNEIQSLKESKA